MATSPSKEEKKKKILHNCTIVAIVRIRSQRSQEYKDPRRQRYSTRDLDR